MCVAIAACGGVGTDLGDGGTGGDGGSVSSTGNDATSGNDASGSDGATSDSGACPDERGRYALTFTGEGCGPTASTGNICIQEDACAITLSTLGGGNNVISSGAVPIASDGSFTGANITEGTSNRSGCEATWDQGTSTLVIDCGGTGTSQSCRATLVRKSPGCN